MSKKIIFSALAMLSFISCTPMKRAQTGIARSVGGSSQYNVGEHEVYCTQGRVCSEVDVIGITSEDKDLGKVRIVFKNRTGDTALIQVRLEIYDKTSHELVDQTRSTNFSLPATQEKAYEVLGISRKNSTIRVFLNTAY